jgi:CBS domain-containing protein
MPATHNDSIFFIPVEEVCHRPVVTCSPDLSLVEMARLMKTYNISGIVVADEDEPVGIVSLRDLRNLIADSVDDISTLTVRDIMKTGLITIHNSDHLFKAIFLMAKHAIHRLIVIDQNGHLSGVLTDADLLRIQTRSPLYLVQEIESAATIDQLRLLGNKMTGMLNYAVSTNADAHSLIQLIAQFNDAFTERLIYILDIHHDIRLPAGAAYLVMGSEGRCEQTLRTDQDSAIVYRDDLSPEKLVKVQRFAERIVTALESVGIPLCPGNMMASNPEWCHSLSEWKRLTAEWITRPSPEHTVSFGVFQDMRILHGEHSFEEELRSHIIECARINSIFFPGMARNIVRFTPPLGMFGRLLVEKSGKSRGKIDLKKGGLFTLTRGVGLIALEAGIMGGTTWDKLSRLHHLNIITDHDLETLTESFTFLIKLRLENQLGAIASGDEPDNLIDPVKLTDKERNQLCSAFKGVCTLIAILHSRYQLDMMAH